MSENHFDENAIAKIARYQKAVLLLILLILVLAGVGGIIMASQHLAELPALFWIPRLLIGIGAATAAYLLSKILYGTGKAILVTVLVLIPVPLIGLVALFVINQKATKVLTAHGVKVGLLGAKSIYAARTSNTAATDNEKD